MSPLLDSDRIKRVESLDVHRDQQRLGQLARIQGGASFTYDLDYARKHRSEPLMAVSFRMPLRVDPYLIHGTNLHPFFAGLLPEGQRIHALIHQVKTSEDDLFSLLAAVGTNTAGNVRVLAGDLAPAPDSALVDSRECADLSFREAYSRSLDGSGELEPATVSGVQPKISAGMISRPVRARTRRREFLLKLSSPDHPRVVENEAFFMELARSAGIETANVELVHDREGVPGLLVERFDRVFGADGPARRLHQEDACQLLDRYPAEKFRVQLWDVAEALQVCSAPLVERQKLLRLQAFSYLIANGHLHARNISVLVREGLVGLSPAYGLLSSLPYGGEELALELESGGKSPNRASFIDLGEGLGVRRPAVEKMLDQLVKSIRPSILRLGEIGLDQRKTHQLARVIGERLRQLEG